MAKERGGLVRPLRQPRFQAIFVSLFASSLGDWAARLALSILVLDRTHSEALSSLVVALSFIPWVGPGQLLATRFGHVSRIKVMVTADLVRAAAYAALLIHMPIPILLAVILVASLATPPFETARSALTVEAVPEEDYGSAIALLDLTDQSSVVIGYLLGGVLVLAGGADLALIVDVATYLISAAALSRVRVQRPPAQTESSRSQLGRAARILLGDQVLRRGLAAFLVVALPAVAIEATAAVYAHSVLHDNADIAGELAAAVPVGILALIPFLPRTGGPRRLLRAASGIALIGAVAGGLAFFGAGLPGALLGYFAAGALQSSGTPAQLAFQPRIPASDRPGVYSLIQGSLMSAQAVGGILGGVVAELFGARQADVGWMAMVAVLSVVLFVLPLPAT